jgi:hypothetical protein
MRKLIVAAAALGVAVLLGASVALAAGAGGAARLPNPAVTMRPGVELVGYKHCDYSGCYYCQYRECDRYYDCGYYKRCCASYHYSDCSPYSGDGGGYGYRRHHYQGGGGGY